MKVRFFAALTLALCLVGAYALAQDIDLTALSYDELVALRDQITIEITSRAEWKEVAVPQGVYEVGVDIPAEYWTLTCTDNPLAMVIITYGKKTNDSKTAIDITDWDYYTMLSNTNPSCSIDMSDGDFLSISGGSVVFTPYIRPSLGF